MANNEDKILHLRNEISLYVDDLAAQVVNSSLAFNIRRFSDEIMELKPGFTFDLKQAKALREQTLKTVKQYVAKAIDDNALIEYLSDAQSILKGEIGHGGGTSMGILDKWLHNDDYKVKQLTEVIKKQERDFKKVCEEIQAYDAEMKRCIEASRTCAPDSWEYRNNERKYNGAKEGKVLKKREAENINKALTQSVRELQLIQHKMATEEEAKNTPPVSSDDLEKIIATISGNQETLDDVAGTKADIIGGIMQETETETRPDSEFARMVAAEQRRQDTMELSGLDIPKKEENFNPRSEFDRLVNDANDKD